MTRNNENEGMQLIALLSAVSARVTSTLSDQLIVTYKLNGTTPKATIDDARARRKVSYVPSSAANDGHLVSTDFALRDVSDS